MNNRDGIRWAPFNSVINGNDLLVEIHEEKTRFKKPTLSEEQIYELEEKIISSYTEHTNINIIFYKNEHAYKVSGIVTKLDSISKKITINGKNILYFSNIIKIL